MRRLLCLGTILAGCSDIGVKTFNASPEAAITSHQGGDELLEGRFVTFRGTFGDPDNQAEDLLVSWFLGEDPVCEDAQRTEDGITQCDLAPPAGDVTVLLEVRDPSGASASASVEVVVVPNATPEATILAPAPGEPFYTDVKVEVEGTVCDAEDEAALLAAWWSSDLDGDLADPIAPDTSGRIAQAYSLTEGEHLLTLWVEDSLGKTGSDSVLVDVGPPNQPPTCAITAPARDGFSPAGESVTFEALVGDPDVPPETLAVSWSSDLDGALGTSQATSDGSVLFPIDSLSAGAHVITLEVADDEGLICTTAISWTVGSPPSVSIDQPTDGATVSSGETVAPRRAR